MYFKNLYYFHLRFVDIFFQTNSAYMLFYERCPIRSTEEQKAHLDVELIQKYNFELSQELAEVYIEVQT